MEPDKTKILVVDDEKPLRMGLLKIVETAGYQSFEAENGNDALKIVEEQQPGLIILDVMMKGMSGLEVCRKLKNDPEKSSIKIIILSARGQIREKEEGLNAGADSYITKPFDYKELMRTVRELLES